MPGSQWYSTHARETPAQAEARRDEEEMWKAARQLNLASGEALQNLEYLDYCSGNKPRLSINLAREWLAKCDSEHAHCHVQGTSRIAPQYLINVIAGKLVYAPKQARYAALSYVWGVGKPLTLTEARRPLLRQSGSLKTASRTVRHAMKFCRKYLGLKYLWVDALCIVQDDEEDQAAQIGKMASIYANAYVTLVAAWGGHANTGLHSRKRESWMPEPPPRLFRVGQTVRETHDQLVQASPWVRRGWTLQELVFSRRAIFFFKDEITWECHCLTWHGELDLPAQIDDCVSRFSPHARGLQHSFWPDLEEYAQLVTDYTRRILTYESDVLHAFSGVTGALARVFEGGFIWGLPQMFFDAALLWQPKNSHSRRTHACLPSWSWMGWDGPVDLKGWKAGYDYRYSTRDTRTTPHLWDRPSSCIVISCVQWRTKRAEADADAWRELRVSGAQYRRIPRPGVPDINPIPAGWQYTDDPRTRRRDPGWPGYWLYNGDKDAAFVYPIPILDQGDPHQLPDQTELLACITSRAYMHVRPRKSSQVWVDIVDDDGAMVGVLRLPVPPQNSSMLGAEKLEFIAISMGAALDEDDESSLLEELDFRPPSPVCLMSHFYNVLWIGRDEVGVAYRKGLGRVFERAWDVAVGDEKIEVVLR